MEVMEKMLDGMKRWKSNDSNGWMEMLKEKDLDVIRIKEMPGIVGRGGGDR